MRRYPAPADREVVGFCAAGLAFGRLASVLASIDAVRRALDIGPASRLVVLLDTHVIRVGKCLRLTRYRSPGWAMAREITDSLRRLDPADPVRYDFSLCHLGMMDACGFGRPRRDGRCPRRGVCRPGGRRPRRPAGSLVRG